MAENLDAIAAVTNLHRAVRFVRDDIRDGPIKHVLNEAPDLTSLAAKLPELRRKLEHHYYEPRRAHIVETVRGSFTTRPLAHVPLEDLIAGQAVLNSVGPVLDQKIPSNSYAYRVNPNRNFKRGKFYSAWYRDWPKFIQSIRQSMSDQLPCMLVTDIAGYFENIDLRLLREMIQEEDVSREVVDLLFTQLQKWTWRSGYYSRPEGLLQGNDITPLYANYYLSDIDASFESSGAVYHRFMDDMNIHTASVADAKRHLMTLNRLLRAKGLTLNSGKTYILKSPDEINNHFRFDLMDELDFLLDDMKQRGIRETQTQRRQLFRRIWKDAKDKPHIVKRIVTAFTRARDPYAYKFVKTWVSEQPALTDHLCKYLRSLEDATQVVADIIDFLDDSDSNLYPDQEQSLVETLGLLAVDDDNLGRRLARLADRKVLDQDVDAYSRALYSTLIYKFGSRPQLERIVDYYLHGRHESEIVKQYFSLAVMRLNDQGRLNRVIDLLKCEGSEQLTELGIFLQRIIETKDSALVRDFLERFCGGNVFHFGSVRVYRLEPRRLIMLNILRHNNDPVIKDLLLATVQRHRHRVDCGHTKRRLDHILAWLT